MVIFENFKNHQIKHLFSIKDLKSLNHNMKNSFYLILIFCVSSFNSFSQTKTSNVVAFMNQKNYTQLNGAGAVLFCLQTANGVLVTGDKQALGSSYGKCLPNPEDSVSWNKIFNYMNWCGFSFIRLNFEHEMIQPAKNVFIWDNPTGYVNEKKNYKIMLKILDWAQANKVDVLIEEHGANVEWLKISDQDLRYSAPNDYNQWAIGVSGLMNNLLNNLNYTCVKMLAIANEPGGWWSWAGGDISLGYAALKPKLSTYGINIPFVGPDCHSSIGDATINTIYNNSKNYIGIFSAHNYAESQQDMLGTRQASSANLVMPAMWTEFGGGDNSGYDWNISVARWQLGCYNNGIDGLGRWSFLNNNDIDGNFSFIQTYDKTNQTLLSTFSRTPNLFYIDGLLSRYVAKGSNIYTTKTDNSYLTPTIFESPSGNFTLIITNSNKNDIYPVNFTFQNLKTNKTLYRYQITEVNKNVENVTVAPSAPIVVTADSPTFMDNLSKNSIYVYSTYNLQSTDNGIVEDGLPLTFSQWKLPDTSFPLNSNAVVFDNANANIRYSSDWVNKTNAGIYNGSLRYTNTIGGYYDFDITGTGFRMYGQQDNGSGTGLVYIDGVFFGYANNFSPLTRNQMMIYESPVLEYRKHTVRVICDGSTTLTSKSNYINIDAIGAYSANAQLSIPLDGEPLPTPPQPPVVDNSTGTNILLNPSFESGNNGNWTNTVTIGSVTGITNTFPARWDLSIPQSGSFALVHATSGNIFNVVTSQTIQNPLDGLYKLRFWARSTGGMITSEIRVKSAAGTFITAIPQTLNSTWSRFTLDSIQIKGVCTVEIADYTTLGRWVAIDNMELFRFSALSTALNSVYQNLNENHVNVSFQNKIVNVESKESINNVSVFDTNGKLVFNEKVGSKKTTINTDNWRAGVYLITVLSANVVVTKKVSLVK